MKGDRIQDVQPNDSHRSAADNARVPEEKGGVHDSAVRRPLAHDLEDPKNAR